MNTIGKWAYQAGAAGTVTLPEGAVVVQIYARSTAGGTVAIFGGTAIPIIATTDFYRLPCNPSQMVVPSSNKTIVFTTTTSYFVEYITPGFS